MRRPISLLDSSGPRIDHRMNNTSNNTEGMHLLLLDGLNIARRCYEANPAPDSPEKAQGAVRSAFASFKRALHEYPATHGLAAFDAGGLTWRHALWSDYRKNRKPMPQELRDELPTLKNRLQDELGLKTLTLEGVEADDVLNTAALKWLACLPLAKVTVVSTDKDLCVLIAQGVRVRDHFKPEWRDADWVERKFGVPPALLADLLALTGDSADDIPGVAGIGVKTAAKLLKDHGSLQAVLASADQVKGKAGQALREGANMAALSRQLVAMKDDLQLGLKVSEMRLC